MKSPKFQLPDLEMSNIPLFCIDNDAHCLEREFAHREEFDIMPLQLDMEITETSKMWKKIVECVQVACKNDFDVIILCNSNHHFTDYYNKYFLFEQILISSQYGCNILLGGIENFNHAVPITENLFWVDSISESCFIILLRSSFTKILQVTPDINENIYNVISSLTSHKFVLYPFISMRLTDAPPHACNIYQEKGEQLSIYQKIFKRYAQRKSY